MEQNGKSALKSRKHGRALSSEPPSGMEGRTDGRRHEASGLVKLGTDTGSMAFSPCLVNKAGPFGLWFPAAATNRS